MYSHSVLVARNGVGVNLGLCNLLGSPTSVSFIKEHEKKFKKIQRPFWTSKSSEIQYLEHFRVDESETYRVQCP